MANIKLLVAYDGTAYRGWQKTRIGPSIEATLEQTLTTILRTPVQLQAASRTDAGVHARGQVVNFITDHQSLNLATLQRSLNGMLPKEIAVWDVAHTYDSFHPTLDSTGKIYHYHICCGKIQLPHHRHYSWHFPYPLEIGKMREAASKFLGKMDFSALTNAKKGESYEDYVRHIKKIDIELIEPERLRLIIEGDNFLYKMVRNLAGTLCYVGCGKMQSEEIEGLLLAQDRRLMGMTAPAHGLILDTVHYSSTAS